nr:hypothetical protein [Mycobacterium sp. E2327]
MRHPDTSGLPGVRRLSGGIRVGGEPKGVDELLVDQGRLGADRLVEVAVTGEGRRRRRRHLVGRGRDDSGDRKCGGRVGRADGGADNVQPAGRRFQQLRHGDDKRHVVFLLMRTAVPKSGTA